MSIFKKGDVVKGVDGSCTTVPITNEYATMDVITASTDSEEVKVSMVSHEYDDVEPFTIFTVPANTLELITALNEAIVNTTESISNEDAFALGII